VKQYSKIVVAVFFISTLQLSRMCCFAQVQHNSGLLNSSSGFHASRFRITVIGETLIASVATAGLQLLWYKKYPHSRFHFFNDNREWLGMDKMGHATSAYNISAVQYDLMRWSGINNQEAILIGGCTGLGYLLMIEIMDGFSSQWGFSPGDMAANIFGAGLFMFQQYKWDEQKIQMRFSFHPSSYAKYNPAELGTNFSQQLLKDYNGQSYWFSFNLRSFIPSASFIPKWVNLDMGYSAEGMTGASANPSEINGKHIPVFERHNKLLLGLGAACSRQNNTPFPGWFNIVRLPLPVIEWTGRSKKLQLIPFYF
jgi:hypothetical protein